jgi:hypothetical protein
VIRKALTEGGKLLLLRDATQDIYGLSKTQTDENCVRCGFTGSWVRLGNCFRIPLRMQSILRRFAAEWLAGSEIDPPGGLIQEQMLTSDPGNSDLVPAALA